jgi:hypothetical protein
MGKSVENPALGPATLDSGQSCHVLMAGNLFMAWHIDRARADRVTGRATVDTTDTTAKPMALFSFPRPSPCSSMRCRMRQSLSAEGYQLVKRVVKISGGEYSIRLFPLQARLRHCPISSTVRFQAILEL